MPARDLPRVLTIPPGAPFLETLADALLDGSLVPGWPDPADPLSLSAGTILLPTRRAARAFASVLAERAGGRAMLLPRIVPLGDVDEAEDAQLLDRAGLFFGEDGGDGDTLPPEASPTARRLALAQLVLAWARSVDRALLRLGDDEQLLVSATPADALALAGDLGALIDTLSIHGKTVEDISALVPDDYSRYWDMSRSFLEIVARQWPDMCREAGVMDAALRRHRLLAAEAERLERQRPDLPLVAAGSTGSMPATAALLAAIARLPRGAVVLPGLDLRLDAESFGTILPGDDAEHPGHPGHPQAMLAKLIEAIGVTRGTVATLGVQSPALAARETLMSEALRPAETTHLWRNRAHRLGPDDVVAALDGIAVVEAVDDREEALAIAVALREAVETPDRVAALVTPDRSLAERVSAELARWGIAVEDSAGQALDRSPAGALARLVAEAAAADFEAGPLLALLAHPGCRLGLPADVLRRGRAALEIGVLRGAALPSGLGALTAAIPGARAICSGRRARRPQARLGAADWNAASAVVEALSRAFAGFSRQDRGGTLDLMALAVAHEAAFAALAAPGPGEAGAPFDGPAGEALAGLFDTAREQPAASLTGTFADYPSFFHRLMAGQLARRAGPTHPRVRILGLLEARLLPADLVVLGGLDEKTWPPEQRGDAFINRPMRLRLGLPSPERRVGQTAHDLAQAMGAAQCVLTRAGKRAGDPTVASRFLQRMEAVAGREAWAAVTARGSRLLALARLLDAAGTPVAATRPAPKPPSASIPRSLSVTEVETLVRDPYAIYARHVLGLDPLDPVGASPDAAVRGSLIHAILGTFAREAKTAFPADPEARLIEIGRAAFANAPELAGRPDVEAFWWPRFERIAAAVAAWEIGRRADGRAVEAEVWGALKIDIPGDEQGFTLRGQADRIEVDPDGGYRIVDFKTGAVPTAKQVKAGFAPQLTLEAAMARAGAFAGVAGGGVARELLYVRLGGGNPALEDRPVRDRAGFDPDALATDHVERLAAMMREFIAGERAFASRPHVQFRKQRGAYDHLARVKEWSIAGADDDASDGDDGGEA